MEDTYITFDTALLAKVKGFTLNNVGSHPYNYYNDDGTEGVIGWGHLHLDSPARLPQSVLHKWLRDEQRLHVEVKPLKSNEDIPVWHAQVFTLKRFSMTFQSFEYVTMFSHGKEYEEAFEKGLVQALNLLKDVENGSNELS